MGVRCVSGKALKAVFFDDGTSEKFDTEAHTIASLTTIRAGILGKLVLPNMSYDNDNKVADASVLTSDSAGNQTLTDPTEESAE
jgi:hypothetical protein